MAASARLTTMVNEMLRDHPHAAKDALRGTGTVREALERAGIFADQAMTSAFVTETLGVVDRLTAQQNRTILDALRDALAASEAVDVKWEGLALDVLDVEVSRDTGGVHVVVRGSD
jgi:hypothetical protein